MVITSFQGKALGGKLCLKEEVPEEGEDQIVKPDGAKERAVAVASDVEWDLRGSVYARTAVNVFLTKEAFHVLPQNVLNVAPFWYVCNCCSIKL